MIHTEIFMIYKIKYIEIGRVKTSQEQLTDDFGEFPPKPLKCDDLPYRFKVVKGSWLKDHFLLLKLFFCFFLLRNKYNFNGLGERARSFLDDISKSIKKIDTVFLEVRKSFFKLKIHNKIFFCFFLLILAPFIFYIYSLCCVENVF